MSSSSGYCNSVDFIYLSEMSQSPKESTTGLPEQLEKGVEQLSGLNMESVNVNHNSPKPEELAAQAYTEGADIHLAPNGQAHLPHEAWHLVKKVQGRVKATQEVKNTPINNDVGLEKEADEMGERALS
jgi:hypothetical protein